MRKSLIRKPRSKRGLQRPLSVVVALAAVLSLAPAPSAVAGTATVTPAEFETCLLDKINDARAAVGARRLIMATDVTGDTRAWSKWMAFNTFRHTTTSERYAILPDGAFTAGENIAWWSDAGLPDCSKIHTMFMGSSGHKANILKSNWRYVALGAYVDNSKGWWVTEIFFDANVALTPSGVERLAGANRFGTAAAISASESPLASWASRRARAVCAWSPSRPGT